MNSPKEASLLWFIFIFAKGLLWLFTFALAQEIKENGSILHSDSRQRQIQQEGICGSGVDEDNTRHAGREDTVKPTSSASTSANSSEALQKQNIYLNSNGNKNHSSCDTSKLRSKQIINKFIKTSQHLS